MKDEIKRRALLPASLILVSLDLVARLGSARVSRVDAGVSSAWTFLGAWLLESFALLGKDCFGEAPKPAREARALPG